MASISLLSDITTKSTAANQGDHSLGLVNADDAAGTILYATVRMPFQTYTTADVLTLVPADLVPIGSVVAPELCTVWNSDNTGTSSLTITKIGVASDDDLYANTVVISNAKVAYSWANGTTIAAQMTTPVRVATQEAIKATMTFTGTFTNSTYLVFRIAYIVKA